MQNAKCKIINNCGMWNAECQIIGSCKDGACPSLRDRNFTSHFTEILRRNSAQKKSDDFSSLLLS